MKKLLSFFPYQLGRSFGYVRRTFTSKMKRDSSKVQIFLAVFMSIALAMELRGVGDVIEFEGAPISLIIVAAAATVGAIWTAIHEVKTNKKFTKEEAEGK